MLSRIALSFVVCVLAIGCESGMMKTSQRPKSGGGNARVASERMPTLYDRLGGESAIRAVVDDFIDRTAANPKVNLAREGVPGFKAWDPSPQNMSQLKQRAADFVIQATGGPVQYRGKDMVTVHTGMKITNEQFDAAGADLKASLDKFQVPKREQDELLAIVESTRKQMVNK